MHLSQKTMQSLALIAVFVCVAIMGTNGHIKPHECCKKVSTDIINVPITGFQLQRRNLPCVKAVIFYTADGAAKCSHWREKWVQEKILELRKLQNSEKDLKMVNATFTPETSASP